MTADASAAGTQQDTGNGAAHVETIHAAIERLALLSDADFALCKKDEAAKFGISAAELATLRRHSLAAAKKAKAAKEAAERVEKKKGHKPSEAIDNDGYISFGPYISSEKGLYFRYEDQDGDNPKQPSYLCGPLKVLAKTEDGTGISWGILLAWSDGAEHSHKWAMPLRMTAGELTEIKARFLDEGLFISPNKSHGELLARYLLTVPVDRRVQCVAKAGWCNGSYVTPAKVYSADVDCGIVYQTEAAGPAEQEIRGTLVEWKEHIGKPAIGNTRLQFAICVALAGPLLHPADEESGGFHITGASSIGKTSLLHVAASASGSALRSWRTTDNAAESWAAEANDGLLILDELSQVDAKAADAMSYMLGNGQGKGRANRGGVARRVQTWRLLMLSSGEIGMAAKMNEGGKKQKAGQAARVIEFSADAGGGHGVFERLPDGMTAAAFAKHLREAATKYRGVVFDEFLTLIVADKDLTEWVRAFRAEWIKDHVKPGSDGQVQRIAGRFALVAAAGELAIEYEILPWPSGTAAHAASVCFLAAVKARGGVGALEIELGIAQVRAFIAANGSSRFENPKDYEPREYQTPNGDTMKREAHPPKTIMRAGWREPDGDDWDYYVTGDAWRDEVCDGFNPATIAKALKGCGLLRTDDDNRLTRQKRFPGHLSVRVYHVLGRILADDDAGKDGTNG